MGTERLEEMPSALLANILTCMEMPDSGVTDRTQATRTVGAYNMLVHLAEGEWDPSSREELIEFIGRIVTNAERQGMSMSVTATKENLPIGKIDYASFFERSPKIVAKELVGKKLQIGRKKGEIVKALPQTKKDNARWLDSRPIFGEDHVDAYVASYRGNHMLFLRTAPNTCVRIDQIQYKDEIYENSNQVCRVFGIHEERTGSVTYDGQTVRISRT